MKIKSDRSKMRLNGAMTILAINIFMILILSSTVIAYSPPLGIPDPGLWGNIHPIDTDAPVWPSSWPDSEAAGYYYIDNTHPNATDSGNPYGYPNKPRKTIPEIAYPAGSYVEIHGGPYSDTAIILSFRGTPEKPCWMRGTASSMPTITGQIRLNDSSYAIIEYLDFNGGDSGCINSYAKYMNNIAVRHCKFRNRNYVGNSSAIGLTPKLGGCIHDIVIYDCEFEALGDWLTTVDQDFHGIVPSLWGRDSTTSEYNIWILGNSFYHLSGNGVQVNAGNWTDSYKYLHHIYLGRNTGHANRQSVLWSKQASHVIMSENICYDSRSHGPQPGDGIGYQYAPDNLWIIFNTIYDCNYGIRQSDSANYGTKDNNVYIIGNLIYNIDPEDKDSYKGTDPWRKGVAISLWTGDYNRYIIDNTIYNCWNGINAIQTGRGSSLTIKGNIISEIDPNSFHVFAFQNVYKDVTIDYCDLFDKDHNARVRWGSTVYTRLSDFKAETGECANCLEVDPQFVNPESSDFKLKSSSPVRDITDLNSVYTKFYNLYGIDISKGKNGVSRPFGAKVDLGAYEFKNSECSIPKTNLRIRN